MNVDEAFLPASPNHTEVEGTLKEFRKYGDDVKSVQLRLITPKSLIQIPQPFRQIHFDSALIQIDFFQIRLRERDQRFFIPAIDF